MISSTFQSASRARVPTVPQFLGNLCTAQACLGRSSGIYFDELTTGALSLVRKHIKETPPAYIMYRLCQHSARHSFDVQVFYGNQSVAINNTTRNFVMKVTPLILNMSVLTLQQLNSFASTIRLFVSPAGKTTLKQARSYTVKVEIKSSFTINSQESKSNSLKLEARFVSPDRIKIAQVIDEGSNENLWDGWILIGNDYYVLNAAFGN